MQPMCFSLFGKLKTCWDAGAFVLSPIFSGGFVAPAPASLVIFTMYQNFCTLHNAQCRVDCPPNTNTLNVRIWEKRTQWCLQNQFEKPYFFRNIYCFSVDTAATFDLSYVFDTKSMRFQLFHFMHPVNSALHFCLLWMHYLHKNANKSKLPAQWQVIIYIFR